jgi:hypothetical protein
VFDLNPRGSWGVAEGQIDGGFTVDDEPLDGTGWPKVSRRG